MTLDRVVREDTGWYAGDFHAHTLHSDGTLTPPELVELAKAEGLDFFAITDHNTADAFPHFGELEDFLVIPGVEVTLDNLHYNVFGLTGDLTWAGPVLQEPIVIPHRDLQDGVNAWLEKAIANDCLNSLNHPLMDPWHCQMEAYDISRLTCLEIWNDPSWYTSTQANMAAVKMWTRWLNAGHRVAAIGGSDFHTPQPKPGEDKPAERIGMPRTWVYAENLSGNAILDALKRRRAYVSLGPTLDLHLEANEELFFIGQDAGEIEGSIRLFGAVSDVEEPFLVKLIHNGEERYVLDGQSGALTFEFPTLAIADEASWYRLDVTRPDGEILAISNPIFHGPRPVPESDHFGDYVDEGLF